MGGCRHAARARPPAACRVQGLGTPCCERTRASPHSCPALWRPICPPGVHSSQALQPAGGLQRVMHSYFSGVAEVFVQASLARHLSLQASRGCAGRGRRYVGGAGWAAAGAARARGMPGNTLRLQKRAARAQQHHRPTNRNQMPQLQVQPARGTSAEAHFSPAFAAQLTVDAHVAAGVVDAAHGLGLWAAHRLAGLGPAGVHHAAALETDLRAGEAGPWRGCQLEHRLQADHKGKRGSRRRGGAGEVSSRAREDDVTASRCARARRRVQEGNAAVLQGIAFKHGL